MPIPSAGFHSVLSGWASPCSACCVGGWGCRVQVHQVGRPEYVFRQVLSIIVRLAQVGLIHCDFNEFNLMVHTAHTHKPQAHGRCAAPLA